MVRPFHVLAYFIPSNLIRRKGFGQGIYCSIVLKGRSRSEVRAALGRGPKIEGVNAKETHHMGEGEDAQAGSPVVGEEISKYTSLH